MKSMLFPNWSGQSRRQTKTEMTWSIQLAFEGGPLLITTVQSWGSSPCSYPADVQELLQDTENGV